MDKFKYKLWDETRKEWINYGFCLLFDEDGNCEILNASGRPFSDRKLIPVLWIGLTNKDGKEIYEGDLIKTKELTWLVEPIGSLERDGRYYGLCVSMNGNGENYFIDQSILAGEIIGNIYETPELLEVRS